MEEIIRGHQDSRRYSGNFVEADDLTIGTNIKKKYVIVRALENLSLIKLKIFDRVRWFSLVFRFRK